MPFAYSLPCSSPWIMLFSIYRKSAFALVFLLELLTIRSIRNTFSYYNINYSFSTTPSIGNTYQIFTNSQSITINNLKSLNPNLDYSKFDNKTKYYISSEVNNNEPTKTITTSIVTKTTTTITISSLTKITKAPSITSSASDYKPTQPRLSKNYNKFYKIVDRDSYNTIKALASIAYS